MNLRCVLRPRKTARETGIEQKRVLGDNEFMKAFLACALIAITGINGQGIDLAFPAPSQLPDKPDLPDPLATMQGRSVTTKEVWFNQRRPELAQLFQHYMYGYLPTKTPKISAVVERVKTNEFGGKATREEIALSFGPPSWPTIHLLLVIPNYPVKRAPVFLGLNFCGNYSVLNDPDIPLPKNWMPSFCPGCADNQATEAGRGRSVNDWAIEQSIDRGYAVATFYNGDIDPDKPDFKDGVHPFLLESGQQEPGPNDWGTIAAWAWGLHRATDYLIQHPRLDPNRIAVFGHSRNGKTALLAAALDTRIGLAIPHQAGCGGTAPSRGKVGETVKQINDRFPHWFNQTFKQFNEHPERLPFDQHCLIAMCAPRPVLLSNAQDDTWANPAGQFEMLLAADKVYRLVGAEGLKVKEMPPLNQLVDSPLGYFIRPGKHSTTPEDWKIFLDFADKHWGKPIH